jgi:uncharacterized protein involved in response to NO
MIGIPRYRPYRGPALLSVGFRPFFLLAALWSALAVPIWILAFSGRADLPTALQPQIWHAHEMIFGYGGAVVAGFMLTAIPNWTGRMPLQGLPLAALALLWLVGRVAVFLSDAIGPVLSTALDLVFPIAFIAVVAREIVVGRNWRNAPMLAALTLLLTGNGLVHLDALRLADTGELGLRIGVATLLMLIGLIGGRIIPSFTGNWLKKRQPEASLPASFGRYDRVTLAGSALALIAWTAAPQNAVTPWLFLVAGLLQAGRLARWRGEKAWRDPLVWVLHLGYAWLALGFVLQAASVWFSWLPASAALHALTAGAIGTMPLAVMTRATLGHTGRPLKAGNGTVAIYVLVTLAALVRLLAPLAGDGYLHALICASILWSAAYGLFVVLYVKPLVGARVETGQPVPASP